MEGDPPPRRRGSNPTPQQPVRSGGTRTPPEGLKGGSSEGPGVVTWLVHYDTGVLYKLGPAGQDVILGSAPGRPGRDIRIESTFVSAHHCRLDQTPLGLCVTDLGSKNGTHFDGEKREKGFFIRPGKMFVVGALTNRFLALNDQMHRSYPVLVDIVGEPAEHTIRSETPSPSDLILAAGQGAHLLITSEPHCEQHELARIVHSISTLRDRTPVEIAQVPVDPALQFDLIERATRSTLVLDLGDDEMRLPSNFLELLFAAKYQVRVIALARSLTVADNALGRSHAREMQHIWLPPLAARHEAIERLLDRMFHERNSPLRVASLTPKNQRALRTYRWPDNFVSLREVADRLTAIGRGSINKAAPEFELAQSVLNYWYKKKIKLSIPLIPKK